MRITMEQAAKLAVILTVTKNGRVHSVCAKNLADKISQLREGKIVRVWLTPRTGFPKKCPNVAMTVDILEVLGVTLETGVRENLSPMVQSRCTQ